MILDVDTGAEATDREKIASAFGGIGRAIHDGILDSIPEDATQAQIDAAIVSYMIATIRTPRTMPTVRRHFTMNWHLIAPLAETDPAGFDEIITALAERSTELPG